MRTQAPQRKSGLQQWLVAHQRGFMFVLTLVYGANAIWWGLGLLDGVEPVRVVFTVIWTVATIASGVAVIFLTLHPPKAPDSFLRKQRRE